MNLANTIRMRNGQAIELASNATAGLWVETRNNKRIIIKKPKPAAASVFEFPMQWNIEHECLQKLSHPNILKILSQEIEDSFHMEHLSMISLAEFIAENPSIVIQQAKLERIIDELMNTLNYLHQQGLFVIDLNPQNILITRNGHNVKLFSICSPYLNIRKQLWPESSAYLAPEIQETNVTINARADIFALGKVIEFIFSNGELPYKFKSVVKRCQDIDPMRRYVSISTLKADIERHAKWKQAINGVKITAGIAALALIGFWIGSSYKAETYEHVEPALDSDNTVSVIEARQQYGIDEDSLAMYLEETSSVTDEEWAISDSIKDRLSTIFKHQFLKKATPIINRIYNQQILNGTGNNFQIALSQGYEELKQIKEQLIKENGLDELTADKIASEVIADLAEKRLKSQP